MRRHAIRTMAIAAAMAFALGTAFAQDDEKECDDIMDELKKLAERLMNAHSAAERKQVEQSIDIDSRVWAESMASVTQPGHRAVRDAWCRAHHAHR